MLNNPVARGGEGGTFNTARETKPKIKYKGQLHTIPDVLPFVYELVTNRPAVQQVASLNRAGGGLVNVLGGKIHNYHREREREEKRERGSFCSIHHIGFKEKTKNGNMCFARST